MDIHISENSLMLAKSVLENLSNIYGSNAVRSLKCTLSVAAQSIKENFCGNIVGSVITSYLHSVSPCKLHETVMDIFCQLYESVDNINDDIKQLEKIIKWEATNIKYSEVVHVIKLSSQYCALIKNSKRSLTKVQRLKIVTTVADDPRRSIKQGYAKSIKEVCHAQKLTTALLALYDGITGKGEFSQDILSSINHTVNGDRHQINKLGCRLLQLFTLGLCVLMVYERLTKGVEFAENLEKHMFQKKKEDVAKVIQTLVLNHCSPLVSELQHNTIVISESAGMEDRLQRNQVVRKQENKLDIEQLLYTETVNRSCHRECSKTMELVQKIMECYVDLKTNKNISYETLDTCKQDLEIALQDNLRYIESSKLAEKNSQNNTIMVSDDKHEEFIEHELRNIEVNTRDKHMPNNINVDDDDDDIHGDGGCDDGHDDKLDHIINVDICIHDQKGTKFPHNDNDSKNISLVIEELIFTCDDEIQRNIQNCLQDTLEENTYEDNQVIRDMIMAKVEDMYDTLYMACFVYDELIDAKKGPSIYVDALGYQVCVNTDGKCAVLLYSHDDQLPVNAPEDVEQTEDIMSMTKQHVNPTTDNERLRNKLKDDAVRFWGVACFSKGINLKTTYNKADEFWYLFQSEEEDVVTRIVCLCRIMMD